MLALPQRDSAVSLVKLTDEMKKFNAYQTLRKEWKEQKGVYKRLEAAKKKKTAPETKGGDKAAAPKK